jgi:nucleoside-diphosphate-sugar epimerase
MRVLIAGATGAIGRPLIRRLKKDRHTVFALARSPESSHALTQFGAEPVTANMLDAASVQAAIDRARPDAVINELTSLPRHYTAAVMRAAAKRDSTARIQGNENLLAALRDTGNCRYLLQSSAFWYAPGDGLADESASFAFDASPRSPPVRGDMPNSKPRHWPHLVLNLSVCDTAFFMARALGFTMTGIWASRSASSRFP